MLTAIANRFDGTLIRTGIISWKDINVQCKMGQPSFQESKLLYGLPFDEMSKVNVVELGSCNKSSGNLWVTV